ncbi:Spy/CpxP family protein refolding chaperone [Shewanella sp. JM162201]|uniref:Spy/CpxP family protein refolding chaperone n=1 Tax=Shewanella jiangmenensis TaxID=2837387 RepID=A0ABS5V468_9GAMM|nr:Spy/CpxP family protein refolding chaperone [Shewanella jiangmenensis]MBT1445255.1 Spy/CpxP family protein refolding chaperone [Shewanella jiangmenensis]
MNKFTQRGLIALMVSGALFSGVASAQSHDEGRHGGRHDGGPMMMENMRHMFKDLNLSDEQKVQLRELMKAHKDARKAERDADGAERDASRAAHHEKMQALMNAPTFDEAAAKALIAERQARGEERALEAMKLQHQMFQLLTPEQKTQLQAKMEQKRQEREAKRAEREERRKERADAL